MSGSTLAINASGYTQKKKGVATNERHGCLLWRLLVSYQRMRTRTGVKEMNEWSRYTFVCNGDCDGLLEFTFRDGYGFPNGVIKTKCPCGSDTTYISIENATIITKELEIA